MDEMPDDFSPQVTMEYDDRGLVIRCSHVTGDGQELWIGHAVKQGDDLAKVPVYFQALKKSVWIASQQ